jgi:O-antigen ligase
MIDKWSILPILACVYVSIVQPLIYFASSYRYTLQTMMESNWENRIFWPVMTVSSVGLAILNYPYFGKRTLPPHIICLLVYAAFAGASVLWAFRPELSFIRFTQQVMILITIMLPAVLAVQTADMMRSLFLCFAFGSILNVLLLNGSQLYVNNVPVGYQGYLAGKNALGQFAAVAFLLALYEMLYRNHRRALGIIVVVVAGILLFFSNSKTSIAFAIFAPLLAGFTLMTRKTMRISPAIVPFIIITLSVFFRDRVSWYLFGDVTLSGRTFIWDFVVYEIKRSPLLGWGYQSFWLVGRDAPSIVEAPGWVKNMPNAHNGYLDTMLEMGLVGFAFLVIFIMATLHAIGRVADRDAARAWLMLSLAIFIIFHNLLESTWMHGGDLLWVVFLVVAAEIGRCWRSTRVISGSRPSRDRPALASHES